MYDAVLTDFTKIDLSPTRAISYNGITTELSDTS